MLKRILFFICTFILMSQSWASTSDQLTDISNSPYETEIRTLVDSNIWPVSATQTTFNPEQPLLLGDQVVLLLKAANLYDQASQFSGGQCPQYPLFSYAVSKRIFTTSSCPSMTGQRTIGNLITTGIRAFKLSDPQALTDYKSLIANYSGINLGTNKKPYGIALNDFKFSWETEALIDFDPSHYSMTSSTYPNLKITRGQAAAMIANMFMIDPPASTVPEVPVNSEITMNSPLENTTLSGSDVTFSWAADGAQTFDVAIGSSQANLDYGWFGNITATQVTVSDLPIDGSPVYVRVFAYFPDSVVIKDFAFTAYSQPAIPVTPEISMSSPLAGTQLTSSTVILDWIADGAQTFDVAVGSSQANLDYGWFGNLSDSQVTVENLPSDGSPIHVRIFAYFPNETITRDFVFTATTESNTGGGTTGGSTGGTGGTPTDPTSQSEIAPSAGSTLATTTQTFSWDPQGATHFDAAVGTSTAYADLGWFGGITQPSFTVSNLPSNGISVWVRIFYYLPDGSSFSRDFSYTATASGETTGSTSGGGTTGGDTGGTTGGGSTSGGGVASTGNCDNPVGTPSSITSVWANDGGDKVVQEDTRGSCNPNAVVNSIWDGNTIKLFGAKNEVVNFNLILEAALGSVSNISVSFDQLTGPNGSVIKSQPANGDGLFNWLDRDIEMFYVRYLEIKGLSAFCCLKYDERHIPKRLQRPWTGDGYGSGLWTDRLDHNKHYPDIAVPLELEPSFNIADKNNQSIWSDIYIPKEATDGLYTGTVTIKENGQIIKTVPVELSVYNFALPDAPSSKTMLFMGYADINNRYLNQKFPSSASDLAASKLIRDRHFMLAHRHKISLIDSDSGSNDTPSADWIPRLNGSLFTSSNGYRGPGENTGNGIFSIGTYGSWGWQNQGEAGMWAHTNNWVNWFKNNAPDSEYFLYLIDESSNYAQIEQWASWIHSNPGIGREMPAMATAGVIDASLHMPSLDVPTTGMYTADTEPFDAAYSYFKNTPGKKVYFYNGGRPGQGSFMTDDDGIALRELAWGQFKKGIDRWFYWESTYYNNYQAGMGETNVFKNAHTFGGYSSNDPVQGEYGWNYSNGDGVLFYPGTDKIYPVESYNINGPIASLRLKHWRRGIQDADYLTLAKQIDPARVDAIVNRMVPKALWENDVTDPSDPSWIRGDVSWSDNPEDWETARKELAEIIANQ